MNPIILQVLISNHDDIFSGQIKPFKKKKFSYHELWISFLIILLHCSFFHLIKSCFAYYIRQEEKISQNSHKSSFESWTRRLVNPQMSVGRRRPMFVGTDARTHFGLWIAQWQAISEAFITITVLLFLRLLCLWIGRIINGFERQILHPKENFWA